MDCDIDREIELEIGITPNAKWFTNVILDFVETLKGSKKEWRIEMEAKSGELVHAAAARIGLVDLPDIVVNECTEKSIIIESSGWKVNSKPLVWKIVDDEGWWRR